MWSRTSPLIGLKYVDFPFDGFKHVDNAKKLDSGVWVNQTATCLHSMMTYLHLIHPAFPLEKQCEWDGTAPGPQIAGHIC
jgi:hypothetical protein